MAISLQFSILLILISALMLVYVVYKVRKSHLSTIDSVFWFIFAFLLLIIGIFPKILIFAADIFEVKSAANLVIPFIIFILIIKEFLNSIEIARLRSKINCLTQELSIKLYNNSDNEEDCNLMQNKGK